MVKASLEIADLIAFSVCKSSTQTDCRSRIKIDQAGTSNHHFEEALKLMN